MSLIKKLVDTKSGCLIYCTFLLWIGILIGIPSLWGQSASISGIIAVAIALTCSCILESKLLFIRNHPLTFLHLTYTLVYTISIWIYIAKGEEIQIIISSIVGMVILLISFLTEIVIQFKKERKYKSVRPITRPGDEFKIRKLSKDDRYFYHEYYTITKIDYDQITYRDASFKYYEESIADFENKMLDSNFSWILENKITH